MFDKNVIETLLDEGHESSSGSTCTFIDLENGWGLKCYYQHDENCRDCAYMCQKEAHKHGFAPAVGESFELGNWYCYVTEVVETVVAYAPDNEYDDDAFFDGSDTEAYFDAKEELIRNLSDKMNCIYTDDHLGNFGYNANGDLVVIDWDSTRSLWRQLRGLE